jgi:hypothetical protein
MKNKRGAESFTVILWIIVGVIVVGLFVYAYYNGFLPILTATKAMPKVDTIILTTCENVKELPATAAENEYCNVLRETENSKYKVTCRFLNSPEGGNKVKQSFDCGTVSLADSSVSLCKDVFRENLRTGNSVDDKLYINNIKCSTKVRCTDLDSEAKLRAEATCPNDGTTYTKISKGLSDSKAGSSCCIPVQV